MHSLLLSLPKTTFLQVTTVRCLTTQIARLPCMQCQGANVATNPGESSKTHEKRRLGSPHIQSPSLEDLSLLSIPVVYYSCISFIHYLRVFHLSPSFRHIRVFHLSRPSVELGFFISLVHPSLQGSLSLSLSLSLSFVALASVAEDKRPIRTG